MNPVEETFLTRLSCALELLKYKAKESKKSGHAALYEEDINEIFVVAGIDPLKDLSDREVKSNDIV